MGVMLRIGGKYLTLEKNEVAATRTTVEEASVSAAEMLWSWWDKESAMYT
jgi:hypothetical protein